MEHEIWEPILGYEGLYKVSNLGRIKRVARMSINKLGHKRQLTEKIMKPFMNYGGYWRVKIKNHDGVLVNITVHRAVCEAFIGPRPPGMVIRHMDGDSNHNTLSNLQYGTHEENMADKVEHGTNSVSKLGEEKALEIINMYDTWRVPVTTIAEQYGVTIGTVNNILSGRTYQNVNQEYSEEDFI